MPANLKNSAADNRIGEGQFSFKTKERKCQTMFKLPYNCTHFTSSMIIPKILQVRLQHYMNRELPDVQAGFRKGRGTRDQIANICWIIEKARGFFCFMDCSNAFDCVDHNKLWKILQEMGISDHLTCCMRNLYAGQEATIRTTHGTPDRFKTRKAVYRGCILFTLLI